MKIAILDFTKGKVTIEEIPEKWKLLDGDDIICEMGYRLCEVEYMIVNNCLDLIVETNTCNLNIKLN